MFAVFAVKIVVKHKSVGTRSLALRASAIVAHTVRLQKQRTPKGGDERAGFLPGTQAGTQATRRLCTSRMERDYPPSS